MISMLITFNIPEAICHKKELQETNTAAFITNACSPKSQCWFQFTNLPAGIIQALADQMMGSRLVYHIRP